MIVIVGSLVAAVCALKLSQVQPQIDAILASVATREHWGVAATALDTQTGASLRFAQLNSQQYFVPASITKLLATSAAYLQFGPAFRFNTSVRLLASSKTLCFDGAGDPSVTYDQVNTAVKQLRATVSSATVDSLAFVDPFAALPSFPPTWEVGDASAYYGAAPTALMLNENTFLLHVSAGAAEGAKATLLFDGGLLDVSLTGELQNFVVTNSSLPTSVSGDMVPFRGGVVLTGTIKAGTSVDLLLAVPRPNRRFCDAFGVALGLGLKTQPLRVASCAGPAVSETNIVSAPLAQLLNWTLQTSDNLYAESFLRLFARNAPSLDAAVAAMHAVLPAEATSEVGAQVDGSGLSRHNRLSPLCFEALLRHVMNWNGTAAQQFVQFLPQAGVSGSLRNRFLGGAPAAKVTYAKTGSMTGVNSLAGVIVRPILVTFAIISNDAARAGAAVRADIDRIVNLMAQIDSLN